MEIKQVLLQKQLVAAMRDGDTRRIDDTYVAIIWNCVGVFEDSHLVELAPVADSPVPSGLDRPLKEEKIGFYETVTRNPALFRRKSTMRARSFSNLVASNSLNESASETESDANRA